MKRKVKRGNQKSEYKGTLNLDEAIIKQKKERKVQGKKKNGKMREDRGTDKGNDKN